MQGGREIMLGLTNKRDGKGIWREERRRYGMKIIKEKKKADEA
jgi:hypothetical protein